MHNVLKRYPHTMVGVDFHLDIMPAVPPVPNPVHCHLVAHVLQGWWTATWADNVQAEKVEIIQMGSDIANGIPHIPMPPSHFLLALLYTAASGSKSHFGPASVQTAKGPIGAALLVVVNPNLNCGSPCPTMSGFVIAPNTVMAGMTFGDILGGIFAIYVDMILATILNVATAKMSPLGGALTQFLLGSPLGKSSADLLVWVFGDNAATTVLTHLPGLPFGWVGKWGGKLSDGARWVGQGIGDGIQSGAQRVFGSDGAAAASAAPSLASQPVSTSAAPNPASDITHNPTVEEF